MPVAFGLQKFVAEIQQRHHPSPVLVVLYHRLHRLIFGYHSADEASEPAVTTARRTLVHNQRTFRIGRSSPVYVEEFYIVVIPGILIFNEILPYIVAGPRGYRSVDPHAV